MPALSPLAVLLLLGACGGEGAGGTPTQGAPAESASSPSESAAQLAGEDVTSLHDAIAIAAARAATEPRDEPDTGAASPTPAAATPLTQDGPTPAPAARPEPRPAAQAPSGTADEEAPAATDPDAPSEPATEQQATAEPEPEADTAPDPAPDTSAEASAETSAEASAETSGETSQASQRESASQPAPAPAPAAEPEAEPEAVAEAEPENAPEPEPAATSAPEPQPEERREASTDAGDSSGETPRQFASVRAPGFEGRVLDDGNVLVTWEPTDGATGYNVYRQSEFYASVPGAEILDEDIVDRDYYYEIQAYFGNGSLERIATGLTVKVRDTGRPDPDAKAPETGFLDDEYTLIFADEFNDGALDPTKWNTRLLWGPEKTINSEDQYYVDIQNEPDFGFDPFTFENGNLVIESIPVPEELRYKMEDNPEHSRLDYLSGIITTYDSLQFTYGYAEIRARVPFGQGYWPAFWLLNEKYDKDWPEIDIMEFIGDDEDTVYHTYHYYDSDHTLRSTPSQPTVGVDWTAEFHKYSVDWRPGQIIYYVDDVEVHRVSDPKVSRENMYVIANTAMGGWWAGAPDETTPFPGRYEIDYIRVYRQIAPYEQAPLSDGESAIEPGDEVLGASPGHRSPFAR